MGGVGNRVAGCGHIVDLLTDESDVEDANMVGSSAGGSDSVVAVDNAVADGAVVVGSSAGSCPGSSFSWTQLSALMGRSIKQPNPNRLEADSDGHKAEVHDRMWLAGLLPSEMSLTHGQLVGCLGDAHWHVSSPLVLRALPTVRVPAVLPSVSPRVNQGLQQATEGLPEGPAWSDQPARIFHNTDGQAYLGTSTGSHRLKRARSGGYDDPILATEALTGRQFIMSASGAGSCQLVSNLADPGTYASKVVVPQITPRSVRQVVWSEGRLPP